MTSRSSWHRFLGICWLLVIACGRPGSESAAIPQPDLTSADREVVVEVQRLSDVIRGEPESAAAWAALGDRLWSHGWNSEAAECFRQAATLEPKEPLWPYREAQSSPDQGSQSDAFRKAVDLDPAYPPAQVYLGERLWQQGDLEGARDHYQRALDLDPDLGHALLGLGRIELQQDEVDDAREHLELAAELLPGHAPVHHALAQLWMRLGDDEHASEHAEMARRVGKTPMMDSRGIAEVPPLGSRQRLQRAATLTRQGRPSEAAQQYREALTIQPQNSQAREELGSLLITLEQPREAETQLREALKQNPDSATALRLLGAALAIQGRTDEAVESLQRGLQLASGDADSLVNLGAVYAQRGEYDLAIEQFELVLAEEPEHLGALRNLGSALEADGQSARAVEVLSRTVDLAPDWIDLMTELAWILATDRNPDVRAPGEAVALAERAQEQASQPIARSLDVLATAYAAEGRFEEASRTAMEAMRLARSHGELEQADEIRSRLLLFQENNTYTRPSGGSGGQCDGSSGQ